MPGAVQCESSSSDCPLVSTPSRATTTAATTNDAAPSVKMPACPATGSSRPTREGPAREPTRPTDEAKPAPVARERVGDNSGVQAYSTDHMPNRKNCIHSPAMISCATGAWLAGSWPEQYAAIALPASISTQVGLRSQASRSQPEQLTQGIPASEIH